ncbi:hypothetical protein P3T76_009927 [Phytophthora citrophthora]|uniref:Uncharacterized protein n=1 Tax=Phytophthora citrophthora TaxID=4793 RepID=A0AAD9LIY9_9STRA|nr:hypothetical protein P3T76_009927 [Phytophthora citrophthora]
MEARLAVLCNVRSVQKNCVTILLEAFRSGSMIIFTEDADIGNVNELIAPDRLKRALWRKGYHMFSFAAPIHPLAARLYDVNLPLSKNFSVLYVDLYRMKRAEYGSYGSILSEAKVWPPSQVIVNGMAFDTQHDPKYFFTEVYGYEFMIPKPRYVRSAME